MNNPIVEGAVFRADWIKWAKRPAWRDFAEIVLYIDPAWKSTAKNDYKAAKLWGKDKKTRLWHLRAFVRQTTLSEMVRWCYDLYEWAQREGIAIKFYMEANFMQDKQLEDFATEGMLRGYQLPILGDKRKSPTSSSALRAWHHFGSVALSFTMRAKRTTPTWCVPSTSHWHSKKVCAATMMPPTQTRVPSIYCKNIQAFQILRHPSANVDRQKT